MEAIFWGCFLGGTLFALVTLILGDILGHLFDGAVDALSFHHFDFLSPMVTVGGLTVFGGTGIMLTRYSPLLISWIVLLSLIAALAVSVVVYFAYVKPMKNAENSIGFSIHDLVGRIGEISIPVPAKGAGEVVLRIGAGNTNQIAESYDGEELPVGTRVVVGEVKEGVLYVFRYEEEL